MSKPAPTIISAEIAASYTHAMHLAQQLEHSMRIILFVGDRYHLLKLNLTRKERQRFSDTQSFLDSAGTAGRLIEALVDARLLVNRNSLQAALYARNELAHWFLVQSCSGNPSALHEKMALWLLEKATRELSKALKKVQKIQAQLERQADEQHAGFAAFMNSLNLAWIVGDRQKYVRKQGSAILRQSS